MTQTTSLLLLLLLQDAVQASGLVFRSQRLASRAQRLVSKALLTLKRIMSPTVLQSTINVRVQAERHREFHFRILLRVLLLAGRLLAPPRTTPSTPPAESMFPMTPILRQLRAQLGKPSWQKPSPSFRIQSAETPVTLNSL